MAPEARHTTRASVLCVASHVSAHAAGRAASGDTDGDICGGGDFNRVVRGVDRAGNAQLPRVHAGFSPLLSAHWPVELMQRPNFGNKGDRCSRQPLEHPPGTDPHPAAL